MDGPHLYENLLTNLSENVFSGLYSLKDLNLESNRLNSISMKIYYTF